MDQDKVNPFVGNTETPAGGSPVSAPSTPVNPYAPAGTPYAPGSNTPAPSYADPISASPAVPNTSASDPAYTSISPAPSQNFDDPEKPKLFTKKFIILVIIGLVLIAGAVVAGIIVQNNKKATGSSANSTSASSDGQGLLNLYTNYIISGTASADKNNASYDENKTYYLPSKLHDITKNAEARGDAESTILSAKKYFDDYYNKKFADNSDQNDADSSIALYRGVVDMLAVIITNQPEYGSESEAAVAQFIQAMNDLNLGPAEVYVELYSEYLDNKTEETRNNLNDFVNSYANYLIYNSFEFSSWVEGSLK